jgi:hypothetical protein
LQTGRTSYSAHDSASNSFEFVTRAQRSDGSDKSDAVASKTDDESTPDGASESDDSASRMAAVESSLEDDEDDDNEGDETAADVCWRTYTVLKMSADPVWANAGMRLNANGKEQ